METSRGGGGNSNELGKYGRSNMDEAEKQEAEYIGVKYAVALSAGTAALHIATTGLG